MSNSIAITSGHSARCRGAVSYVDEFDENVRVSDRVHALLLAAGVKSAVFHDMNSTTSSQNLSTLNSWHNQQSRDLDVQIHFNAYQTTQNPMGTEVLYVTQSDLAAKVSSDIATAGHFLNRGAKYRSDLSFLNSTNKPAILIEVCFVDSKSDVDLYKKHFEEICQAIAESISGVTIEDGEEGVGDGGEIPPGGAKTRPLIGRGDYGTNVREVQNCLNVGDDGQFGPATESAVIAFQADNGLSVDGMVGEQTWTALNQVYGLPPYPFPLPPVFSERQKNAICDLAGASSLARVQWRDRGLAPAGYVKGMALAWAQAYVRYVDMADGVSRELGKANTGNDDLDALSWYNSNFVSLGMTNDEQSVDTLRHLYVLLMGLGMRESSGQHCCGRDQSADNTSSTTAEAGLFQTSFNASVCCTDFLNLFDAYEIDSPQGYMNVFAQGVSCSSADWGCYGSGDGYHFQRLCKYDPTFAVETCGIVLRNLRQHYGPINRKEAELRREADDLFQAIQRLLEATV